MRLPTEGDQTFDKRPDFRGKGFKEKSIDSKLLKSRVSGVYEYTEYDTESSVIDRNKGRTMDTTGMVF